MKLSGLFSILVLLSLSCLAQTGPVKLYGYNQPVLGGVPPASETDEEGKKNEAKTTAGRNLFIYLSYPQTLDVRLVEIWMKGHLYNAEQVTVKSPVKIFYYNGQYATDSTTLVPYTTDTVIQLVLRDQISIKTPLIKKPLTNANDLIIAYRLNGKINTQILKKIKGLRSAAMQ